MMRYRTRPREDGVTIDSPTLNPPSDQRVYVILCVYDPDEVLFTSQLTSLLEQTHRNIEIVVVPDGPEPGAQEIVERFRDSRLLYIPESKKVGVYGNFVRALAHAVSMSTSREDLFAYSDQDDIWLPEKVSRQVAYLRDHPECSLVHSDARVVDEAGNIIHDSIFAYEKRERVSTLSRLLLLNNVTGMTAVFRKSVAKLAVNAPPHKGLFFHHDLWTALIAASVGRIGLIEAPLVNYAQHDRNVIGAMEIARTHKPRKRGFMTRAYVRMCVDQYVVRYFLFRRLKAALGDPKGPPSSGFVRKLCGAGFFGGEALLYAAGLAAAGKPKLAQQAFRMAVGKAALLTQALRIKSKGSVVHRFRARANGECQTVLGYTASPETVIEATWQAYEDRRMLPIENLEFSSPVRAVNLLAPTFNPDQIFAGVATAIDFASMFANHGFHVRFVATDMPIRDKAASKNFILGRLRGSERSVLARNCTLVDFRNEHQRIVGRDDLWIATAWWTAHVANAAVQAPSCRQDRFIYLIQDFEPGFYAWSADYANALASYSLDFAPVFNTTYLRDYFTNSRFLSPEVPAMCFSPSLRLDKYEPDPEHLNSVERRKKRVIFYGRPGVARNLFELGISALANWCANCRLNPTQIELFSVGELHSNVALPNGLVLQSLGKLSWDQYPSFLQTGDIGLSLMLSPHPSHIPFEMAASGIVCVTNRYGPKDLTRFSGNIISVEPSITALESGLGAALSRSDDAIQRRKDANFSVNLGDPLESIVAQVAQEPALQRSEDKTADRQYSPANLGAKT